MTALYEAVQYTVRAGIPGSFVECGVWKGGSLLVVARALLALGVTDRDLIGFDTFAGMPPGPRRTCGMTAGGASMPRR